VGLRRQVPTGRSRRAHRRRSGAGLGGPDPPSRGDRSGRCGAALAGLDADGDPGGWLATTEAALGGISHRVDARYGALLAIVSDMLADRELVSVAQVEQRHHVTSRTLQRWFMHYVGVGPKWVLARYRMHDVVTAIDGGYAGSPHRARPPLRLV